MSRLTYNSLVRGAAPTVVVAGSLLGCQLPLNNAACPCAPGWVCCPDNNICVSDTTARCPGGPDGEHPDGPGPDADDPGETGGGARAQRVELVHGWASDWFGSAVALAGDRAAAGVPGRDDTASNAGAVVVFERRGGTHRLPTFFPPADVWVQVALLAAPDPVDELRFGSALAFLGQDTLLIGGPGAAGGAGRAYLYRRTSGGWSWQQTIDPDLTGLSADEIARLGFGRVLAADGDRAIVNGSAGVAHVYQLAPAGLVHVARLASPDGATRVVHDVAIHGASAVLTTSIFASSRTYVFDEAAGWTAALVTELPDHGTSRFLAFDGQRLAIARRSGSVRLLARTQSGWSEPDDVALPANPEPEIPLDLDLAWAGSDLILTTKTPSAGLGLERIRSIGGRWQPDPIVVLDAGPTAQSTPLAVSGDRVLIGLPYAASPPVLAGHATVYRLDDAGIAQEQTLQLDDGPLSSDGVFAAGGGHLLASTSRGNFPPLDRHDLQEIWYERDRDGLYRRRPSLITDGIRLPDQPIAVAGSHALVAVVGESYAKTPVQTFELADRDWRPGQILGPTGAEGFGSSMALDGDTAVFGALVNIVDGIALVYTWANAAWTQTATLDGELRDCVPSVAIAGSRIAVFCNRRNLLRMFQRSDSTWHEMPAPARSDDTVAIVGLVLSGDRVGISSMRTADDHIVSEVFRWSDGVWRSELRVRSDRSATNCGFACRFGIAALSGDRLVLYRDATSLAAYRFVSGAWAEQPPFVLPPSQRSPDAVVLRAALTDDELIASVPNDSNGVDPHAGAIYVFPWK